MIKKQIAIFFTVAIFVVLTLVILSIIHIRTANGSPFVDTDQSISYLPIVHTYKQVAKPSSVTSVYDVNGDGCVNGYDVQLVQAHIGEGCEQETPTLTPTMIVPTSTIIPASTKTPDPTNTNTPIPTLTATPTATGLLMIYEGTLASYMPSDLGSPYGHNFYVGWVQGIPEQLPKLNYISQTDWSDPYDTNNPVSYNGNITLESIALDSQNHPRNNRIFGEENNQWYPECPGALFDGKICPGAFGEYPSPEVYAHWLKDVTDAVKLGWGNQEHGMIIPFYLMQDDLRPIEGCGNNGHGFSTAEYLRRFEAEWTRLGFGEIPVDAIVYNHHPSCSSAGEETSFGGYTRSTAYWNAKKLEMASFDWLDNAEMWIETTYGRTLYNTDTYMSCDSAKRLQNITTWSKSHGIGGLLWFHTVYDDPNRWYMFKYAALYTTLAQGQLSVVGRTFRDGVVPSTCKYYY